MLIEQCLEAMLKICRDEESSREMKKRVSRSLCGVLKQLRKCEIAEKKAMVTRFIFAAWPYILRLLHHPSDK
jgi:hypothetical protein